MGNTLETSTNCESYVEENIDELFKIDPYLKPYENEIRRRQNCFNQQLQLIDRHENGLFEFTLSYKRYGYHVDSKNNVNFLEWAPNAKNIYVRGDFSNINIKSLLKCNRASQPDLIKFQKVSNRFVSTNLCKYLNSISL